MTTLRTSVELSKDLLVACDQSYFTSAAQLVGEMLTWLPDRVFPIPPEYTLQNVYRDQPQYFPTAGYRVEGIVDRTAQKGGKALIYKHTVTGEIIVAFGGTDGISTQDWVTNTQSAGWEQWVDLRQSVFGLLQTIGGAGLQNGSIPRINFTGQSLGGALAQYAAVEFFKQIPFQSFDAQNVTLTTFNGLGAVSALQSNGYGAELATFNNKLGQVAHYVVENDLVARLGGGHIGSNGKIVNFDWKYLEGNYANRPLDLVDSHRIETAF